MGTPGDVYYFYERRFRTQLIGLLIVGIIIGALALLLKPGRQRLSLVATLALGVVGALLGGVVASLLGIGDIVELNVLGFVVAVIAAVLLVGAAEGLSSKSPLTRLTLRDPDADQILPCNELDAEGGPA